MLLSVDVAHALHPNKKEKMDITNMPVMGSTDEGSIQQLGQARGMKRALAKMVEDVVAATKDCEHRILAISHCNCPERAQYVKACLEKLARFKKIVIVDTAGISSMYANDGGIIIACLLYTSKT